MNPLPIAPYLIPLIFHWGITLFCLSICMRYVSSPDCKNLLQQNSVTGGIVLAIVLIFFIGLRPIAAIFGDTAVYAWGYNKMAVTHITVDWNKEWLFQAISIWCKSNKWNVTVFFLIIETGYIGFMLWAYKKALSENFWMASLFALSAFSFFTYGVNGMRNGLACSMVTLGIIFLAKDRNIPVAIVLCGLALGVHKSTLLPTAALAAAFFVLKNPKIALWFWVASIPVSLVAGGPISNYFMSLGFDDRATSYMSGHNAQYGNFSSTGFRWDFLLYSAMPVWMIWFVMKTIDKKREEMGGFCQEEDESGIVGAGIVADKVSMRVFNVLATVYLLTNAFWVMVIKAAFSNRFAYLSWFIYPLVLAYAVIRLHLWENQDKKAAWILLAHAIFTQFMWLIGKA